MQKLIEFLEKKGVKFDRMEKNFDEIVEDFLKRARKCSKGKGDFGVLSMIKTMMKNVDGILSTQKKHMTDLENKLKEKYDGKEEREALAPFYEGLAKRQISYDKKKEHVLEVLEKVNQQVRIQRYRMAFLQCPPA